MFGLRGEKISVRPVSPKARKKSLPLSAFHDVATHSVTIPCTAWCPKMLRT